MFPVRSCWSYRSQLHGASTAKQDGESGQPKDARKGKRRSRRRSHSSSSESTDGESRRSSRRGRGKRRKGKKKHRHKRSVSESSSGSSGSDRSRSRSRGGDKGERRKRRSDATHAAIGCVQLATDEGNTAVTAPLVHVTVGGLPVVAMLDTGAEVSLVASHVVVGLKDGPNLSRFQMATPVMVTGVGHA